MQALPARRQSTRRAGQEAGQINGIGCSPVPSSRRAPCGRHPLRRPPSPPGPRSAAGGLLAQRSHDLLSAGVPGLDVEQSGEVRYPAHTLYGSNSDGSDALRSIAGPTPCERFCDPSCRAIDVIVQLRPSSPPCLHSHTAISAPENPVPSDYRWGGFDGHSGNFRRPQKGNLTQVGNSWPESGSTANAMEPGQPVRRNLGGGTSSRGFLMTVDRPRGWNRR